MSKYALDLVNGLKCIYIAPLKSTDFSEKFYNTCHIHPVLIMLIHWLRRIKHQTTNPPISGCLYLLSCDRPHLANRNGWRVILALAGPQNHFVLWNRDSGLCHIFYTVTILMRDVMKVQDLSFTNSALLKSHHSVATTATSHTSALFVLKWQRYSYYAVISVSTWG